MKQKQHPKANPPNVAVCPHCGHKTTHDLLHREDFFIDTKEKTLEECWWAILRCGTCDGLSLYRDYWDEARKKWSGRLIYPAPTLAPIEVPEGIRRLFTDAVSMHDLTPSLCAVGMRICLEAVCIDQGATRETLSLRVRELGQRGILPESLVQLMDSRQITDNLGVHADTNDVTKDDIQVLIDFCLAILEFVYVAPSKIAAVKMRLAQAKNT